MTTNKKRLRKRNRPPQERPRWSEQDLRRLLRLYGNTPNFIIAWRLKRTLQSIAAKAHKLRLKKELERLVRMGRENIARRWGKKRSTRRPARASRTRRSPARRP